MKRSLSWDPHISLAVQWELNAAAAQRPAGPAYYPVSDAAETSHYHLLLAVLPNSVFMAGIHWQLYLQLGFRAT